MEDIHFTCLQCNGRLQVDASGAGQRIECPICQKPITIPLAMGQDPNPIVYPSEIDELPESAVAQVAESQPGTFVEVGYRGHTENATRYEITPTADSALLVMQDYSISGPVGQQTQIDLKNFTEMRLSVLGTWSNYAAEVVVIVIAGAVMAFLVFLVLLLGIAVKSNTIVFVCGLSLLCYPFLILKRVVSGRSPPSAVLSAPDALKQPPKEFKFPNEDLLAAFSEMIRQNTKLSIVGDIPCAKKKEPPAPV